MELNCGEQKKHLEAWTYISYTVLKVYLFEICGKGENKSED